MAILKMGGRFAKGLARGGKAIDYWMGGQLHNADKFCLLVWWHTAISKFSLWKASISDFHFPPSSL